MTPKRMDADSRKEIRQLWRHSGIRDAASKLVCDERVPGAALNRSLSTCCPTGRRKSFRCSPMRRPLNRSDKPLVHVLVLRPVWVQVRADSLEEARIVAERIPDVRAVYEVSWIPGGTLT